MEIIKKHRPHILFTTDEETGALGADAFTKAMPKEYREFIDFIIEIDRRGFNQAVFYNCGNKDFENYILSFGFQKQFGSFSDISVLSPFYDIASVNLSAGYYNEHTKQEYIVMDHLRHTINLVEKILNDTKNFKKYDYQEARYFNTYSKDYDYYDGYEDYDDYGRRSKDYEEEWEYNSFMEEDWHTLTAEEWKSIYGTEKPKTEEDLFVMMCGK